MKLQLLQTKVEFTVSLLLLKVGGLTLKHVSQSRKTLKLTFRLRSLLTF